MYLKVNTHSFLFSNLLKYSFKTDIECATESKYIQELRKTQKHLVMTIRNAINKYTQ